MLDRRFRSSLRVTAARVPSASAALLLLAVVALGLGQYQLQGELRRLREAAGDAEDQSRRLRAAAEAAVTPAQLQEELQRLRAVTDAQKEALAAQQAELNATRAALAEAIADANDDGRTLWDDSDEGRRLGAHMYSLGSGATKGCYTIAGGDTAINLAGDNCGGARCPSCFYYATAADHTLTITNTGTAYHAGASTAADKIREYMFINAAAANKLTITDGDNTRSFIIAPLTMGFAAVKTQTNAFYWQTNYGISGTVEMCPDGCNSQTAKLSSDATTAVTQIPTLTAGETTSVQHLHAVPLTADCTNAPTCSR